MQDFWWKISNITIYNVIRRMKLIIFNDSNEKKWTLKTKETNEIEIY